MTENRMVTAKELAHILALSKRSIFRTTAAGKLPRPYKIGGAIRWRLSDIERWQNMGCPDRRNGTGPNQNVSYVSEFYRIPAPLSTAI